MPYKWTLQKLQGLTIKELEILERNVRAKGEEDLGDQCFEVRLTKLSPAARKKALGIFTFEKTVARDLGNFARDLDKEFDLSKETATKFGTPHPHALTDNRGDAKTGGAMKSGRFALDRYISYRLKDSKLTVAVILHLSRTIDQAVYAVILRGRRDCGEGWEDRAMARDRSSPAVGVATPEARELKHVCHPSPSSRRQSLVLASALRPTRENVLQDLLRLGMRWLKGGQGSGHRMA